MAVTEGLVGEHLRAFRRFTSAFAIALAAIVLVPTLVALATAPSASLYLGVQYNTDDHMVYAAWMRQAMDGRFLFDNRFTTDPQPGLTVHLYFFVLGLLAKGIGLIAASTFARIGFTALFVVLVGRLIERLNPPVFLGKMTLAFVGVGGGLGFLWWRNYGIAMKEGAIGAGLTYGLLPIDVWQPEAFAFPSMLTNGLFMVSLCLILWVLGSVLACRKSWTGVASGAVGLALLMNIHSYDVLLVAFVLIGYLVCTLSTRQASWGWIGRVALIGAGAIPPALWFAYVHANDPVFQARAATETFSPSFRQVLLGLLPLIGLAAAGLWSSDRRQRVGFGVLVGTLLAGWMFASAKIDTYWLGPMGWCIGFALVLLALWGLAREDLTWNLVLAWALVGLVAPYFPGLFQRKLLMGVEVPWAILAAYGLFALVRNQDVGRRQMVGALAVLVLAGSSLRWFSRELVSIRADVSNTTVHPVFLSDDIRRIVRYLDRVPGRKVVLAMPGIPARAEADDTYLYPAMPDLNPIVSGLTGAYTYAGHWSETPDYARRRAEVMQNLFLLPTATPERQRALIEKSGANYIVAPRPEAFGAEQVADVRPLGQVVVEGERFDLVKLK